MTDGSRSHLISGHGVKLTVPAGRTRASPASDGAVVDPKTLLVLGTRGVKPKASRCQIAAYRIPPPGAVVVVVGWKSLRNSGASGAEEGRSPLTRLVRVRRPSYECFDGRDAPPISCSQAGPTR
jgi:hypothetical protein